MQLMRGKILGKKILKMNFMGNFHTLTGFSHLLVQYLSEVFLACLEYIGENHHLSCKEAADVNLADLCF